MPQNQAAPDGEQTRMVPESLSDFFKPTCYFRYERRDQACPNLTLQQWWTTWVHASACTTPEDCQQGEWRDVPIVQEPPGQKTFIPINQDD